MTVRIGIIMGSDSDLPVMQEAAKILDQFQIPYELSIVSVHRTPEKMVDYAKSARSRGIQVIIAGAGGAAHLPGMVASMTELPVIGVPVQSKSMSGIDSLYSIVQMPPGVPVATVAINGARNAGILAAQILGCADSRIADLVATFKNSMRSEVLDKAKKVETLGYDNYLKQI
jgi:5-(carboxyamino)imidazole ribonucleotide mutase